VLPGKSNHKTPQAGRGEQAADTMLLLLLLLLLCPAALQAPVAAGQEQFVDPAGPV
jgi:hypothetical protein